jgi:hypothetical protein
LIRTEEEHLAHYGIKRRSGRYPWGSGEANQLGTKRNKTFLDDVARLRKDGMTEAKIAEAMGITTTQLRARKSIAVAEQRREKIMTAERLRERGWGYSEIGRRMDLNESSVRALLAEGAKDKADALHTTANMLKAQVAEKKYVDVGVGVEKQIGVTNTRLNTAVAVLKEEGYVVHPIQVRQVGTGQMTKMLVLAKPGTPWSEVQQNKGQIRQIQEYSTDHGRSYVRVQPPISVSSRRIAINYGKEGAKADGVIYVRPGVDELRIGNNRYGQVRIAVDGTHYLKGMAVYKDDLPEGVDLVFNTNKPKGRSKKDVMQPMSKDPDNPFGTIIRQVHDPKTGKVNSVMNMVGGKEGAGEAGYWDTWSRSLSSQMLSKQSPDLAKQQLGITHDRKLREFDEINSLTNPVVRRELLLRFADSTDHSAAHLEAAALPRTANKVILPIPSMKETEVYAPTMRDGEMVALIRHPHGGTFEIPRLKVNNQNREARKMIGTGLGASDAIGIHHNVAKRLSGADFDGDTVLVIPDRRRTIKTTPALKELENFDPQIYKLPKDSPIPRMKKGQQKQTEMGKISNLITDMSLQGAPPDEIARAVKHSMVVIDAEKHGLDYRRSEKDNGILQLKEKYQGGKRKGAATLISRAGAEVRIDEKRPRPARRGGPIDPLTGKKVYEPTGKMIPERKSRINPTTGKREYYTTGRMVPKKTKSERLVEAEDAYELIRGEKRPPYRMEEIYADHSNRLKALANSARKEALQTKLIPYSPSARVAYKSQVASINHKLNVAEKNAPYERQAQVLANLKISQVRRANPDMDADDIKKLRQTALADARTRTGAHKQRIVLTQDEWNAIQAGAISKDKLERVLTNSDMDTVKRLAMPKPKLKMTSTNTRRAERLLNAGYTQAEVADMLGVGLTTLKIALGE